MEATPTESHAPPSIIPSITEGLAQSADGIWYATDSESVSYPSHGHDTCLAVEEGSFWFNHRNAAIQALVSTFAPPEDSVILDVGGGNGYVSLSLAAAGWTVVLVEPGATGAKNARDRGVEHVICATTETARVAPRSVGAIGLFDVIEHIEDDVGFLEDMASLLVEDGRIYATVPAYQTLWSSDDVRAGHYRRYSKPQISGAFNRAGLDVDYATHFFRPLPLPVFAARSVPSRVRQALGNERPAPKPGISTSAGRSHASGGGRMSKLLSRALRPELDNISKRTTMRVGGSILLSARLK